MRSEFVAKILKALSVELESREEHKPEAPDDTEHLRSAGGLLEAKVLDIVDGDTFRILTLKGGAQVRLFAVDCPEDDQPWGERATNGLNFFIAKRDVYLETHGWDPHKRLIATVFVMKDGELINVNQEMVKCGHAWVSTLHYQTLSKVRKKQLILLERWARANKVGLWKAENPIPPWTWRKRNSA